MYVAPVVQLVTSKPSDVGTVVVVVVIPYAVCVGTYLSIHC